MGPGLARWRRARHDLLPPLAALCLLLGCTQAFGMFGNDGSEATIVSEASRLPDNPQGAQECVPEPPKMDLAISNQPWMARKINVIISDLVYLAGAGVEGFSAAVDGTAAGIPPAGLPDARGVRLADCQGWSLPHILQEMEIL